MKVSRVATPTLLPNDNRVDVDYIVQIEDKVAGSRKEIHETHSMRYLFKPELELMTSEAGLKIVTSEEWMTGKAPGFGTWGVCFVAKV